MRRALTDRQIKNLRPRQKRYDTAPDLHVPGLIVRVFPSGQKSFALCARFPGKQNGTRKTLGVWGKMSLEEARETGRRWHEAIRAGQDPTKPVEVAPGAPEPGTFADAAARYTKRISGLRQAKDATRYVKRLIKVWGDKRLDQISRADVVALITTVGDDSLYAAHNLFGTARALFNFLVETGEIEASPCDRVKVGRLIGKREPRERHLSNTEIASFWRQCDGLGYPYGPAFQILLLTGCRKNEILHAKWSEIDGETLVIPKSRFKSKAQHQVPLSSLARSILASIPRFEQGDYIFSNTGGTLPVSKADEFKAKINLGEPFRLHDLRRTLKFLCASLKIDRHLSEKLLGHGPRDQLDRHYDVYTYADELAEAAEKVATKITSIIAPTPDDTVVPIKKRA